MPFQFRKEAIEEDLNSNFPSQGQGNPPLYYSLSEVVVPTYSINSTAEGSGLPQMLQTAWDFSTGYQKSAGTTDTIITNPGFWKVDLTASGSSAIAEVRINNGLGTKTVWFLGMAGDSVADDSFIVFLKAGESLEQRTNAASGQINSWFRQIATINGQLINPLGFSFA